MEINYNTILKYLYSEHSDDTNHNDFPTKKNIMVSSDNFPESITKHFIQNGKKLFYRYGITRYNNEQINISFLSSFLTLLNKNFMTMDKKEELTEISNLISEIRSKVLEKGFKFELKYKFEHQILLDRIKQLDFDDGLLIQLISQLLDINFLIFNFDDNKIYTIFKGDFLNPWKVTFLIAKSEKNWEPLFSDKKQFSFNDSFLKKILINEEIHYYNHEYLNKCYSLLDNVTEISNLDNNLEDNNSEDNNSEDNKSETFINPSNQLKKMNLTKTKLKNLKKNDVYKLIESLNLTEITKDTTKKIMIDKLLPYI